MEYEGGTTTGTGALRHETFHSWWARGLKPAGPPTFAYYDPPWTLPFLRRNEVVVPVAVWSGPYLMVALAVLLWVLAVASATVPVPAAVLDRYVGAYELAPDFVITVRRDGDVLRAQPTGQPEMAMVAESETRFFVREANATVVFESDASGAVTRLVLHRGGRQLPARKIR